MTTILFYSFFKVDGDTQSGTWRSMAKEKERWWRHAMALKASGEKCHFNSHLADQSKCHGHRKDNTLIGMGSVERDSGYLDKNIICCSGSNILCGGNSIDVMLMDSEPTLILNRGVEGLIHLVILDPGTRCAELSILSHYAWAASSCGAGLPSVLGWMLCLWYTLMYWFSIADTTNDHKFCLKIIIS